MAKADLILRTEYLEDDVFITRKSQRKYAACVLELNVVHRSFTRMSGRASCSYEAETGKQSAEDLTMRQEGYSIQIDERNKNGQVVLAKTGLSGSDHLQKIYILGCEKCGFIYGANGSDCWQRRCPECDQNAAPGERYRPHSE
jgi:hypothetical protein